MIILESITPCARKNLSTFLFGNDGHQGRRNRGESRQRSVVEPQDWLQEGHVQMFPATLCAAVSSVWASSSDARYFKGGADAAKLWAAYHQSRGLELRDLALVFRGL